ncbi:DUF2254 domain-containing protein [Paracoccus sp. Z118]|uniref:DUF2254 domain-containing protein n=1 Tax=Paracoccus sp. Z118 TaxID=2851017 RepID=UPI001C2CB200|nr:DUF2254 domain-containing protein [Paracoccus sp. Z118]MBV0891767.1 DUF2254 domain-containing protein [Paracoccus sp. Z118]
MNEGLLYAARELWRKPWVRVVLFSLLGIAVARLSGYITAVVPIDLSIELAAGSVDSLLNIVASSMLAVTTFSVGILVSSYSGATQTATPRATDLLVSDPTAQNAMAIFIGSFLFSIVGIIGLSAGFYNSQSRVVLFVATLGMIALIVSALLRWINHLNSFGRMGDIIERIENAATDAAVAVGESPRWGALPGSDDMRTLGHVLASPETGAIRHIDYAHLESVAEKAGMVVQLAHPAGHYVHRGEPLLYLSQPLNEGKRAQEVAGDLAGAFLIADKRGFDQDPRYGLIVMSEVGSRALSASINDPGTAIDVLRAGTRILLAFHAARESPGPPVFTRVAGPDLDLTKAYQEFFAPFVRDGSDLAEVQEVLQKSLAALARAGGADHARPLADRALKAALGEATNAADEAAIRAAHAQVRRAP